MNRFTHILLWEANRTDHCSCRKGINPRMQCSNLRGYIRFLHDAETDARIHMNVFCRHVGISSALLIVSLWASVVAADELADLPDPTMPYSTAVKSMRKGEPVEAESLRLQSIMVMPGDNYAIINGQRVREGAYIEGVRVESIQSDGVMVATGKERRLLTLGDSGIVRQR